MNDTLENLEQEMIELRRHFHQYPELSFEEVEIPKTIVAFHKQLGLEVREHVGERGVVKAQVLVRPSPFGQTLMRYRLKKRRIFHISQRSMGSCMRVAMMRIQQLR